ncbi:MAG TPA: TonB-dependent receptor, partial [bacterium]|nr:TonB-dependent receptor [bacterium]
MNIDLTTTVNFELQPQAIAGQEVIVEAEEPVVKADISASRVDISSEQVESLPVTDLDEVIGIQAGVQGLSIRGSNADEVGFTLDGLNINSARNKNPYTGVSYTAVQEVQVQAGGFNAEYGDMRSGVVNVATIEGSSSRYSGELLFRYSPPGKKYFGMSPKNPNSYWMRPYLDPEVMWEGTDVWGAYTQKQYPGFDGWDAIIQQTQEDDNQENDLNREGAVDLFEWRTRRDIEIDRPDYTFDASFNGPVPFVSEPLGDLRFLLSYRQMNEEYIVPLSRSGYLENNAMLKLTSNITSNLKLNFQGMYGTQLGTNTAGGRGASPWTSVSRVGDREHVRGFDGNFSFNTGVINWDRIFNPGYYSKGDLIHNMQALKLTHSLSPQTFYEVRFQRYRTDYESYPIRQRDPETVKIFPENYHADEAPLGFSYLPDNSEWGLRMGAHHSEFRDTSYSADYQVNFDLSSQVNRTNLVKAGLRLRISEHSINYEHVDFLENPDDIYDSFDQSPLYFAGYLQDKLEFGGMIANVGLRFDYQNPRSEWFDYNNPFADAFMGKYWREMENRNLEGLQTLGINGFKSAPANWSLSPRLGISFPVTAASKIYFNYGHFRQTLIPEHMYMTQRDIIADAVRMMSNPDMPFPTTVAYELGYEQSVLNMFQIRIAGYYKALDNQPRWEWYHSENGLINYMVNMPHNYEDIRGFEISLFKNVGRHIRGFINYNFMAQKFGDFGVPDHYENRVQQRQFEREYRAYQDKPLPKPYARFSLEFLVPPEFGPQFGGIHPAGNWNINLLGRWQAGDYFTYTGDVDVPGVENNMQWVDYRMVDLRLSKH